MWFEKQQPVNQTPLSLRYYLLFRLNTWVQVWCSWDSWHGDERLFLTKRGGKVSIVWVGLAQEVEQLYLTERLLVRSPAPPSWVLMCPWARHLTLTAPDELAVALHGWLCRRCVNVCINWCKSLWIKASAKCPKCKCKWIYFLTCTSWIYLHKCWPKSHSFLEGSLVWSNCC